MKTTTLILLVLSLHLSVFAKSQDRITVVLRNTVWSKALTAVEKASNYRFVYSNDLAPINRKIDLVVRDADLPEVMDKLLTSTTLSYKVMPENVVVLYSKVSVAPEIKVSGRITDENGSPLGGASVRVRGTNLGVSANANGEYSITVPDDAVLLFSYVGYDERQISVSGQSTINVSLKASVKVQDQVVVIGYGTAAKRDLTGSITKISGREVADKPNTNPVASLQSKVPGLYVVNNGTPGKEPDIRIRGTQSIGQVKPLYVVDGIFQDNIDYINPNDIESIEVMKDPSSLAIFGVRGGTGVIAITTKRARSGQTVINYSGSYGFKKLVDKIEMVSAAQFDELFDEENANNNVPTPNYSAVKGLNNTDWIDAVTRTGKFMSHNISLSGTSDKNRFNFGVGYVSDEGIILREKLKKYLISFGDEYKINSAIKIGINLNASRQENPYDATWVLDAARKVMPHISPDPKIMRVRDLYGTAFDSINIPVYSGLVTALQSSGVVNPLLHIENEWDKVISRENRYVGNVYADVTFLKYFNARATWYADVSDVNRRQYNGMFYAYNPMDNTPYLYSGNQTSVVENNDLYKKYQQDYILTYKKKFGDHSLTATGGFTTFYFGARNNYAKSTGGGVGNLPIPNDPDKWYITNNFGRVLEGDARGRATEYTTVSYLGRFLYNYRGKYYLNASIRDDASSRIPEKNRHQQFWAVGAAWEISKETFMADQKIVDFLKLKGSIGVLGNQSTYHPYLPTLDYPFYPGIIQGSQANFGTVGYVAALPAYQKNPDLKWETVNSYEIGIEANAFDNRLHFEFNYYNKRTKDMMTYIGLGALGYDDIIKNGGEIKNWGEEISASWNQQFSRNLTLTLSGNITFMDNKVISVAEDLPGGIIIDARANNGSAEARTTPGYPIGSFFGYVVEGLYQTDLDRLVSPFAGSVGTYLNGDFKFKDVNGDGIISDLDRTVIGNPSPDFIYGGSIGLKYKKLNIDVDFGGVYGNEVFRVWAALESPFQRVNYAALKLDRWNGAGTSNWEPIISQGHRFNYNGSTYNIEDGSYFRIRNLQVGYDITAKALTKAHVRNLRVFVNAQNLKTWKRNNGYTAEFGGRATAFGFDEAGGAIPRVVTFGVNVNFE